MKVKKYLIMGLFLILACTIYILAPYVTIN